MASFIINDENIRDLVKNYFENKNKLPKQLKKTKIGDWDVSQVTNMDSLFMHKTNFNENLNKWNVSNVTNMRGMFINCNIFNQPLNNWNVSNVTNMANMFANCTRFNQPLNKWNVSKVTTMSDMFPNCKSFNQPLNQWNVSNVTDMSNMFGDCESFNQPLNDWNVSKVTNMMLMFENCEEFDQPLNNWDVSNVTDMNGMFSGCSSFDQPLTNWNITNAQDDMDNMFDDCPISEENKPKNIKNEETNDITNVKTPLENSSVQINPSSQIGSDLINMEQDINVLNFINKDPKNIAFYFNNQIYLTSKDSLHYSITDPENQGKNIKYECLTTGSMNPSNIVFTNPYFSMRSIGSYGLVSLGQINEIIQNESIKYVEMTTEPIKQLVSTASLQVTGPNPNYVGASHCQEGQGENVYNLLNITNISTTGGRKRKYTKKRKNKRTKKRKMKRNNKSKNKK